MVGCINIDIYDTKVRWAVAEDIETCAKELNIPYDEIVEYKTFYGLAMSYKGKYYLLAIKKDMFNTIPHEALHIVNMIFNSKGIEYTTLHDEHATYLLGYVCGKILDKLIKRPIISTQNTYI